MYREYFGLKETPFSISPDPHYFYISEGHREALAHLLYGINIDGGFVLLTGEVGTGKTTVCRCLLEQIPENCHIAFILNPKLSSVELLAAICDEFQVSYSRSSRNIKDLVDRLNRFLFKIHEKGGRAILIIEEAQNLTVDVLEQVRLLTNLETNQRKLLQIIMLGQPELKELLSRPELRQLNQRITARYHLGPLAKNEISDYVNHRLSVAGLTRGELFPQPMIKELFRLTGGVPRLINIICDRALLGTYTQGKERIDKRTLLHSAMEVSGKQAGKGRLKRVYLGILGIVLLNVLVGGGVLYYRNKSIPDPKTSSNITLPQADRPGKENTSTVGSTRAQETGFISTRDKAYETLFHAWQARYDAMSNSPPDKQAQAAGLHWFEGKADLNILRKLNKPVVLRFIEATGKEYYIALTRLNGNIATYTQDGELKTGDIRELTQRWSGDYALLSRLPTMGGDMTPSRNSKDDAPRTSKFAKTVTEKLKAFQLAAGLKPGGGVDPNVVITTHGNDPVLLDPAGGS
jgi:general secretion pathway protein A